MEFLETKSAHQAERNVLSTALHAPHKFPQFYLFRKYQGLNEEGIQAAEQECDRHRRSADLCKCGVVRGRCMPRIYGNKLGPKCRPSLVLDPMLGPTNIE